jgi:hypothetical protein
MDAQPEGVILIDAAALDEQRQRPDDAAGQLGDISAFRQGGRRVVALNDQEEAVCVKRKSALYFSGTQ